MIRAANRRLRPSVLIACAYVVLGVMLGTAVYIESVQADLDARYAAMGLPASEAMDYTWFYLLWIGGSGLAAVAISHERISPCVSVDVTIESDRSL